jgi:LCP family protein required for cell wall assembly
VLGSDDRTGLSAEDLERFGTLDDIGGQERSDTIILVHTEPDQEKATILSFPRDLWVDLPDGGQGKINSAFSGGIEGKGAQRVAATVTDLTGLKIHHVMYVNLAGFQGLVDAVDGVDMCFPYDMQDPLAGLDLRAGCHHLDGAQALAVVRTRNLEGDCIPDFARITRQQQFFRALLSKLLSPGQITNLPGLVRAAAKNLWIDEGLTPAELGHLASQLQGISTGQADFRAVPGDIRTRYQDGVELSVVTLTPAAREMFRALREGRPLGTIGEQQEDTALSPANVPAAVYDKRSGGAAQATLDILAKSGFDVDLALRDPSSLDVAVTGSALLYEPGEEAARDVAATYLAGLKQVEVPKGTLGELDVAVVVTAGYEPVEPGSEGGAPAPQPEC